MQGFHKDGQFYFFDPGIRFPGVEFERIYKKIWGIDFKMDTRTVDMHVKTLRQKLGEQCSIIQTVRNVGYKAQ